MTHHKPHIIIGLGKTGLSCARYLARSKIPFSIMDTRENPPGLAEFRENFPNVEVHLKGLDQNILSQAGALIVSPGLSVHEPAIAECYRKGIPVIGDIE